MEIRTLVRILRSKTAQEWTEERGISLDVQQYTKRSSWRRAGVHGQMTGVLGRKVYDNLPMDSTDHIPDEIWDVMVYADEKAAWDALEVALKAAGEI